MAIDPKVIEAKKNEHRGVFQIDGHDVLVRKPNLGEHRRFRAAVMEGGTKAAMATEQLARDVVVHPDLDAYDALVEDFPGVPDLIATAVSKLAKGEESAHAKKL